MLRASTTSATLPPCPHRPSSHFHEPLAALLKLGNMYISGGRSFTYNQPGAASAPTLAWSGSLLSSAMRDRRVSRSFETVPVNCVSILGRLSLRVRRPESVPACCQRILTQDLPLALAPAIRQLDSRVRRGQRLFSQGLPGLLHDQGLQSASTLDLKAWL